MEKQSICPLCGLPTCITKVNDDWDYQIYCKSYNAEFFVRPNIFEDLQGKLLFGRLMNLIAEKIIRQKKAVNTHKWVFYYNEHEENKPEDAQCFNLASMLLNYPSSFADCIDRGLLNLSIIRPQYGAYLDHLDNYGRLFYPNTANYSHENLYKHLNNTFNMLLDLGYIVKHGQNQSYRISAEGWKHISEISKKYSEIKQGFIAMSFKEETKTIRECFKTSIMKAGFIPQIMDEKEHNHQIVPEMLREIEVSKFLVMDITYPNYGAYYEAGYALALGKEVIICCNKKALTEDTYERPHFDVAQASMVVWESEDELVERLTKRIKATVRE